MTLKFLNFPYTQKRLSKRCLDVFVVITSLPLILPLLIILAIVIRFKLGSPILFKQTRPGRNSTTFVMIKFRTMTDRKNENGEPLPDVERLTTFGKFLRSTSLDELPELWNVLIGNMSLVGPRPLLVEYLPFYTREQNRRHEVKPGITGWAQVNGRNAISWDEKFSLDVWYVENQSFWLDIKILFLTAKKVFFREDISPHGAEIMPRLDKKDEQQ